MMKFHSKVRSPKHRRYVAMKPCLVCGWWNETIVPHHLLRGGGKGMGTKACDSMCVPLHDTCHKLLHMDGKEVEWFNEMGLKYEEVLDAVKNLCITSPCKKIRGIYESNSSLGR